MAENFALDLFMQNRMGGHPAIDTGGAGPGNGLFSISLSFLGDMKLPSFESMQNKLTPAIPFLKAFSGLAAAMNPLNPGAVGILKGPVAHSGLGGIASGKIYTISSPSRSGG